MINRRHSNIQAYCSEDISHIENYDKAMADTEHMWDCHHRNEICLANQSRLDKGITSRKQLKADGMYYNRPACELIFLRHDEHRRLHHTGNKYCCGKHRSDETKRKIAEKSRGKSHSDETKRKISENIKGHIVTSDTRRKIASAHPLKKMVEMKRKSDGFTMTFPSQSEAVRWLRLNGYSKATTAGISMCANGHRATIYGAKWRYL